MMSRLMIAGTRSGCGKTTVTCALLQSWKRSGKKLMACKSGPDYIDPMFHSRIIGTQSTNLDLHFSTAEQVRGLLVRDSAEVDLTVMEGAMGFYDGIALTSHASAWELAKVTETPVILVVDGRGSSVSICAEITGFLHFEKQSSICGVLLNQVSPMLYPRLKALIEERCGVAVCGYLPKLTDCTIESRHLGLLTAAEISDLHEKLDRLADTAEKTVDFEALEKLAASAALLPDAPSGYGESLGGNPVIAVAMDEAFCFYYHEIFRCLQELGGKIVTFSPIHDAGLPNCDALYIGGGYPELYAEKLARNASMREDILKKLRNGLPFIAECGGFLYLHDTLEDEAGEKHSMCGYFKGNGFPVGRLMRFGYLELYAKEDAMLLKKGESAPAHEFHYWDCDDPGIDLHGKKPFSDRSWECAHVGENFYAGFPHFYLPSRPKMAMRFLKKALHYRKEHEHET